jgi:hypothetical protein
LSELSKIREEIIELEEYLFRWWTQPENTIKKARDKLLSIAERLKNVNIDSELLKGISTDSELDKELG